MAIIGTLNAGQPASIDFAADLANSGVSIVVCTWLGAANPQGPILEVAPATNQTDNVDVPNCNLLQINIHLPLSGKGILTITQGAAVTTQQVTESSIWAMVV